MITNNVDVEELIEEKVKIEEDHQNVLVLYNDDVNSFEHVIMCLTLICQHSPIQAEQCALIAHQNGRCVIKKGDYLKLEKMKYALDDNKLSVSIE